jgi:hypothetical protein
MNTQVNTQINTQLDVRDNSDANPNSFYVQDIVWAVSVWTVILTLSPVVMFFVLMVN